MPDNFIPFYEKTGEIIKLDMYVLEEVCKLQKINGKNKMLDCYPYQLMNLRHHLKNINHIKELKELIKKYNVDTNFIELEMTETTIIEDIEVAKNAEKEAHITEDLEYQLDDCWHRIFSF